MQRWTGPLVTLLPRSWLVQSGAGAVLLSWPVPVLLVMAALSMPLPLPLFSVHPTLTHSLTYLAQVAS